MKLTKQQIANRRTWADALQSSRKAKWALATEDGRMCCLGVACVVLAGKKPRELVWAHLPLDRNVDLDTYVGGSWMNEGFVEMNDGPNGLTHANIGLYLYLTAEAGEVNV